MTLIHVTDENTGQLVEIDIENPTGTLYVIDADTGDLVPVDLSSPTGILTVLDADTGDFVDIDYSNPVAVFNVNDPNTGEIIEIDLSNPTGTLFCLDENTGDFVEVDLSTAKFVFSGGAAIPLVAGDTEAPTVETFTATSPSTSLDIDITAFTASEVGVEFIITLSSTPPEVDDVNWSSSAPETYTVESDNTYTLYPWVKDSSGNISAEFDTPVEVLVLNPANVPGLIEWYDFSDISTLFQDAARTTPVTADGQTIQGVADKSGNDWHIASGAATYKTNIQGGKSAALYDGATDFLRTADVVTHGIGTGDFYSIIVDRPVVVVDLHTIWSNGMYAPAFYHAAGAPPVINGYFSGNVIFSPGVCSTANHIIEIYRSSGTFQLLVDGVDQGTTANGIAVVNAQTTLGWDNYANGDRYNGYQMEFMLFNTLPSAENRAALRSYLSSKWGF